MRSIEAYMSAEASLAFRTVPLINRVASATSGSGFERLRSWINSTSARATLCASSKNLAVRSTFSVAYRSRASVTGMFRPLTITSIWPPSSAAFQPSAITLGSGSPLLLAREMSALLPAARLREPSRYPPPTRIADWPTDQPKPSYTGQGMNLARARLAKTPEHSLTVAPLVKTSSTRRFFPPQTLVPRKRPALHGGELDLFPGPAHGL